MTSTKLSEMKNKIVRELKEYQKNVHRMEYLKAKLQECTGGKGCLTDIPDAVLKDMQLEYQQLDARISFLLGAIVDLNADEQQVVKCLLLSKMPGHVVQDELGITRKKLYTIRKEAIDRLVGVYERCGTGLLT